MAKKKGGSNKRSKALKAARKDGRITRAEAKGLKDLGISKKQITNTRKGSVNVSKAATKAVTPKPKTKTAPKPKVDGTAVTNRGKFTTAQANQIQRAIKQVENPPPIQVTNPDGTTQASPQGVDYGSLNSQRLVSKAAKFAGVSDISGANDINKIKNYLRGDNVTQQVGGNRASGNFNDITGAIREDINRARDVQKEYENKGTLNRTDPKFDELLQGTREQLNGPLAPGVTKERIEQPGRKLNSELGFGELTKAGNRGGFKRDGKGGKRKVSEYPGAPLAPGVTQAQLPNQLLNQANALRGYQSNVSSTKGPVSTTYPGAPLAPGVDRASLPNQIKQQLPQGFAGNLDRADVATPQPSIPPAPTLGGSPTTGPLRDLQLGDDGVAQPAVTKTPYQNTADTLADETIADPVGDDPFADLVSGFNDKLSDLELRITGLDDLNQQYRATNSLLNQGLDDANEARKAALDRQKQIAKAFVPGANPNALSVGYGDARKRTRKAMNNNLSDLAILSDIDQAKNPLAGLQLA